MWQSSRTLWLIYILAALVVSYLKLSVGINASGYTAYENYIIFKNSFAHLVQGQNPYAGYPAEQWDLYKYSPAFALVMAPFHWLSNWLGLHLWNLANALPLLAAIMHLPLIDASKRQFMAWFILPELVVSMQNSQSNGLTAALLLWAFIALEKQKPVAAAGWTAAGGFLKIFGVFAAIPALIYPTWRVFLPALAAWSALLFLLPLVVLSPEQLWQVYAWWWELLREDHSASVGLSVLGWLETWFGFKASKIGVTLAGLVLLGASVLAVHRQPSTVNRINVWASVLIWVVIFNHKAESPTFVIALCGVALWYLTDEKPPVWKKILFWTAFALASLSPTDIFPRIIREQWVQPYVLKAVPCIIIWLIITWQLISKRIFAAESPSNDLIT